MSTARDLTIESSTGLRHPGNLDVAGGAARRASLRRRINAVSGDRGPESRPRDSETIRSAVLCAAYKVSRWLGAIAADKALTAWEWGTEGGFSRIGVSLLIYGLYFGFLAVIGLGVAKLVGLAMGV